MKKIKDIFIIGGGINGTSIACDAAGRGLTVTLCEKGDLASGTSSYSTKLIHGGLRYLEHYQFAMVRDALLECNLLEKKAPHLISPMQFILPEAKHLRPAWMIRIGLLFYDYLAKRSSLPHSKSIILSHEIPKNPLTSQFIKGFSYYDFFTDDSRLVIENALSAAEKGADILTYTEFISAYRLDSLWHVQLKNSLTGVVQTHYARALINVAGPWVREVQQRINAFQQPFAVELVQGSHLVVEKLYEGEFAFILQQDDYRIIFAIPYLEKFTLIGTTDILVTHPVSAIASDEEKNYLLICINKYFKKKLDLNDIRWSYAGIRCLQKEDLVKNLSKISRDYKILLADYENKAPLVTIIGGKLTSFRRLAEQVMQKLHTYFPQMQATWTANTPFPGGRIQCDTFADFFKKIKENYSFLPEKLVYRYAKNYGARIFILLAGVKTLSDLGKYFGAGLYQHEIDFLVKYEWANTMDDILWRRTKLGLFLTGKEIETLF